MLEKTQPTSENKPYFCFLSCNPLKSRGLLCTFNTGNLMWAPNIVLENLAVQNEAQIYGETLTTWSTKTV